MNNKVFLNFILVICLFYSKLSISGDPGGLFLFITPMKSVINEKDYVDNYFKQHYALSRGDTPECETQGATAMQNHQPQVDVFYLKTKISGVDDDLLEKSISNNKSRTTLRKLLVNFKDKRVQGGFDAILFYKLKDDVVYFYGLSAIYKPEPLKKSSIAVNDLADENKLGHALCLALAGLPTPAP